MPSNFVERAAMEFYRSYYNMLACEKTYLFLVVFFFFDVLFDVL